MKVLFITNHYLHRPSGGCFCTSAYINAFYDFFEEDLVLFYPIEKQNDIPQYVTSGLCKISKIDNRIRLSKFVGYLFGKLTRYCFDDFVSLIPVQEIKLVVLDGSLIGGTFVEAFNRFGIKCITIHHNIESEYHVDSRTPVSIFGLFSFHINRRERAAVRNSILNLTLTMHDLITLSQKYSTDKIYFRCTSTFEYKEKEKISILPKKNKDITIVITGALNSYQTIDAITYFINELLPLIKDCIPNLKVLVAGKFPGSELISLCIKNEIELIDSPQDMTSILQRADIYICPTRLGGGLKLRIMDGLSCGLPILTHKISSRGYDMFNKYPWFCEYSSPLQFKVNCLEMVNKLSTFNRLEIQSIYTNHFSFLNGKNRLYSIIVEHNLL